MQNTSTCNNISTKDFFDYLDSHLGNYEKTTREIIRILFCISYKTEQVPINVFDIWNSLGYDKFYSPKESIELFNDFMKNKLGCNSFPELIQFFRKNFPKRAS